MLALNPSGLVPGLREGEITVTQSLANLDAVPRVVEITGRGMRLPAFRAAEPGAQTDVE